MAMINRMRILTNNVRPIQRRFMGGHSIEAAEADTKQWINITIGAFGACGIVTAW
eukprot:CAMPEP_0114335998 /NCGR_PEP_ID=MMETSP0101-20121206/5419_1 /TAXON_ID=38822 ORGANISM="Pteridomonas danica, Strain PT" /NCGR_SAMPLE_ID=MMETSP0101 /ASSEMBLY_ACC=CAM_ASM_000211 /LENGTH=54 /DNA_ID=CAMNT_0001467785 /DNA_START=31 /DNA_END=192 /DNA_ORIENTATION=-